ncbi:MAG: polysaccharide biosynthesis/export family protein, partial [Pyrinomonadaceae bacterium]
EQYRIGPGDLLDIRVISRPTLSRESVRVDERGTIQMPWIQREIQAVCRTERELADELASLYRRYQRNPQIDVFVKEYQSKPVAVIGAVNTPGRFQLQRKVRLLELLTFVNGPAERAGRTVQIIHASNPTRCAETTNAAPEVAGDGAVQAAEGDEEEEGVTSLALSDVLRAAGQSNPYVQPGDIVTVLEAEQVFVVGNVLKPSTLSLREELTVSQAVAMAGGVMPDTRSEKIRIIRLTPAGKQELYVDLKAIDKRQADDIALQANDIVDVPSSLTTTKRVLRGILGSIAPTIGQLPVRVIR